MRRQSQNLSSRAARTRRLPPQHHAPPHQTLLGARIGKIDQRITHDERRAPKRVSEWTEEHMTTPTPHGERTTHFRMLPVEAPPEVPVLFVETSDGMYSLARLEDIEHLKQQMREVLEAVAGMHVESDIFDQPLFALMHADHEKDAAWHQRLIDLARTLLAS